MTIRKIFHVLALVCLFFYDLAASKAQILESTVFDLETNKPIEFVSVGVIGKPYGALTDSSGRFKMSVANLKDLANDTLNISMLGYSSEAYVLDGSTKFPEAIYLKPMEIALNEVIVNSGKRKVVTKGSKSTTRRFVTGWGSYCRGSERGLKIAVGRKRATIAQAKVHVANNEHDSVLFRLHIRAIRGGIPEMPLLHSQVVSVSKKGSGWSTFDLSGVDELYSGDIAVSVEVLRTWGDTKNGSLHISANPVKGPLFFKEAGEDRWQKMQMYSPSIVVDLVYVDD